jgi:hypothetical protein
MSFWTDRPLATGTRRHDRRSPLDQSLSRGVIVDQPTVHGRSTDVLLEEAPLKAQNRRAVGWTQMQLLRSSSAVHHSQHPPPTLQPCCSPITVTSAAASFRTIILTRPKWSNYHDTTSRLLQRTTTTDSIPVTHVAT